MHNCKEQESELQNWFWMVIVAQKNYWTSVKNVARNLKRLQQRCE